MALWHFQEGRCLECAEAHANSFSYIWSEAECVESSNTTPQACVTRVTSGKRFVSPVTQALDLPSYRAYRLRFASPVAKVIDACYTRSTANCQTDVAHCGQKPDC